MVCFIIRFDGNLTQRATKDPYFCPFINYKMKYIKYLFLILSIALISDVISYTSGSSPGYTGAISEGNCTSCHASYSLVTSGNQWNRIRMKSDIPSTGYLPDSTYTITLTYAETGIAKFGFQLTALDTTNAAAGTFSTADSRTSTSSTSVGGKTRYYIGQTTTGATRVATDSTAWTFKWKAPSSNVGKVKFFINLNATNNNGSDNGDYIYKKDFTITPSTLLPVASARMGDPVSCTNGTKFEGSATNSPTAYLWEEKPATGANTRLSTAQNPTLILSAGKHTILFTATNAYGKSNTVTLYIATYTSPPKASTTPKGTSTICSGDSLKITVAALNATLYKQKWLHNNSTKTTVFVKDTGSYVNLAVSIEGCSTLTDPIKILVNPKPIANVSLFQAKSAYCVNSQVTWKAALNKGDSISVIGATGPFTGDSLIKTVAKVASPKEKFWVKGSNGCMSVPVTLSYTVVDSTFAPQLASIDSQLTQVLFRWKSNPLAVAYSYSKDSGKTWNVTGSNGLDTFVAIATPADKSPVSLWVRFSINNDCGVSPIARFSATTKACAPIDFSAVWTTTPLCVGGTAKVNLTNLPSRFHLWVDGVAKGSSSQINVNINAINGKIDMAVLDSSKAVCGTTKKSLSWSAESITQNQIKHDIDALAPKTTCGSTIWLPYNTDTTAVKSAWVFINNQPKIQLSNINSGVVKVPVSNGDSLWIQGKTSSGCVANSTVIHVIVKPLPNTNFTYSNTGAIYTFTPADTSGDHMWYIQSAPGWISTAVKPVQNLAAFSNQTVRVFHEVTKSGDSCFAVEYKDLVLGELSTVVLIVPRISTFPNPVKVGQWIQIRGDSDWSHCEITDASGRIVLRSNRNEALKDQILFEGKAGLYYLRCYRGDELIGQTSLLCTE